MRVGFVFPPYYFSVVSRIPIEWSKQGNNAKMSSAHNDCFNAFHVDVFLLFINLPFQRSVIYPNIVK